MSRSPIIRRRPPGEPQALPASLPPVLRRVYAARGLSDPAQLALELKNLLPSDSLLGIGPAAELLAQAIRDKRRIVIAG
ncbi:single-stranded-DNA-specific exonuclease RecJ, partial [Escherichia coli]|nr:single-stranded-DNA-specific exonuclease RecJ [Escherichia coli]